jgi:hypothetical protein
VRYSVPHEHVDERVWVRWAGDELVVTVIDPDGRQLLIGLEHRDGERAYLLDLDGDAIYVLADTRHPLAQPQHRVA